MSRAHRGSGQRSGKEVVALTKEAKALWQRLIDGYTVRSRDANDVHTIKGDGQHTVAEVCAGKTKTRLNFKSDPSGMKGVKIPKGIELGGKSKSWAGGGLVVTEENFDGARALLDAVVHADVPTEAPAETPAEETGEREAAAARLEQAAKEQEKATA